MGCFCVYRLARRRYYVVGWVRVAIWVSRGFYGHPVGFNGHWPDMAGMFGQCGVGLTLSGIMGLECDILGSRGTMLPKSVSG